MLIFFGRKRARMVFRYRMNLHPRCRKCLVIASSLSNRLL